MLSAWSASVNHSLVHVGRRGGPPTLTLDDACPSRHHRQRAPTRSGLLTGPRACLTGPEEGPMSDIREVLDDT
eukprot:14452256-Alexandrium_andersonii.AAC.1